MRTSSSAESVRFLRLVDDHDQLALCARELEKKIIQAFMHAHDVPAGINDAEFVLWGRFS